MKKRVLFCLMLASFALTLTACSAVNQDINDHSDSQIISQDKQNDVSDEEASNQSSDVSEEISTQSLDPAAQHWLEKRKEDKETTTLTLDDVNNIISDAKNAAESGKITVGEYIYQWLVSDNGEITPGYVAYDRSDFSKNHIYGGTYSYTAIKNDNDDIYEYILIPFPFRAEYAEIGHVKFDKNYELLEAEILYTPTDPNSEGLTLEMVKEIIDKSKTAAPALGITRTRYMLNEFDKKQAVSYDAGGANTYACYPLKLQDERLYGQVWAMGEKRDEVTEISYFIEDKATHNTIESGTLYKKDVS